MTTSAEQLENLIDIGLRRRNADVIITGAKLLDVFRGTWVEGDLAIGAGKVVSFAGNNLSAERTIDASGKWVVPGFFEAHYHAGGTHLAPDRLAHSLLRRGTTAAVCDWQEFYVVAGKEAVREAIDASLQVGLHLFYLVPIHWLVINDLASARQKMNPEDLIEMLRWPETVAINEPPPGPILAKNPEALRVIADAINSGKIYTGHAPQLADEVLQAYVSTGASSDHESTSSAEAWSKLAYGVKVMMRHGSAAPDMEQLIDLAVQHPTAARHMMLVSDEIDPVDLLERGHIDEKVRRAVEAGVDPVVAYQMVTLNPAEYYRVDHLVGSLAPGRSGDAVILDDPETASIWQVVVGGIPVDELDVPDSTYSEAMRAPVRLAREITSADFLVPSETDRRVRVVGVSSGSLLSTCETAELTSKQGNLVADTENDVLKMAVVDRAGGRTTVGFVSGFGIGDSAVATTYAHTFYNMLVIGGDEENMAAAANSVAAMGGGVAVVDSGQVKARWPLQLAGVFATAPLEDVVRDFLEVNRAMKSVGCPMTSPLLALSFAALPTIPELGLTTDGLYHVESGQFLNVVIDG